MKALHFIGRWIKRHRQVQLIICGTFGHVSHVVGSVMLPCRGGWRRRKLTQCMVCGAKDGPWVAVDDPVGYTKRMKALSPDGGKGWGSWAQELE